MPYPSLTDAFDNPGISADTHTAAGNFDGGGLSYSAQALATVGLTPGASVTHDGMTFTWPNARPGAPDNVVADGQTIAMSGSGTKLGLLGASDYFGASGTGTIVYADGTTQHFKLTVPDWFADSAPHGGDILATLPFINWRGGRVDMRVSVYYVAVPLRAGKKLKYLKLPDISEGVSKRSIALHIFAISLYR